MGSLPLPWVPMALGSSQTAPHEQPAEQEKRRVSSCLSSCLLSALAALAPVACVSGLEVVEGEGWLGSGLALPQVCAADQEG